jgi:hypothetical protein
MDKKRSRYCGCDQDRKNREYGNKKRRLFPLKTYFIDAIKQEDIADHKTGQGKFFNYD